MPIATDGSGTDEDPQLQEFTPDPLSAPERVLDRHRPNQLLDLGFEVRPAQLRSGSPSPVEAPALAVPTDDGRWPDHQQMTSPALIHAANQQPKQLVLSSELEAGTSSKGDLELLAEQQVFDDEVLPAAEAPQESADQQRDQIKHQIRIADQPLWPPVTVFCPPTPRRRTSVGQADDDAAGAAVASWGPKVWVQVTTVRAETSMPRSGEELGDLAGGERVAQIPAHRGDDDVGWPTVAGERAARGMGEVSMAGTAGEALAAAAVETIAPGGGLVTGRAGGHRPTYRRHPTTSQTRRRCHGHPGGRADQGRLTVSPHGGHRALICLSPKWHRTTSRTPTIGSIRQIQRLSGSITDVLYYSLPSSGRYRVRAEDRLPWATSSQTMECRRAKLGPAGSATLPGRSNRSPSSSPHSQASSGSDTSATCARSWPSSSIPRLPSPAACSLQAPVPKPQASHGGNATGSRRAPPCLRERAA